MSKRRINIRGVVHKNGQILAVRHKNSHGIVADYWAVPGGGLDPLESIEDGLKREFIEELGVTPTIGRLLLVQQYRTTKKDFDEELELFFEVTNADDFATIDLTATSHGKDEIARCEFVDPAAVKFLPEILSQDVFLNTLYDPTAPVQIFNQL